MEEAFKFCSHSIAEELLNPNRFTLILEPHDCQINYVNIESHHQPGISVDEAHTYLLQNDPSGEEQGEMTVFTGYT